MTPGMYDPHEDDLKIIADLVNRRILTGLEWAGKEWTECLVSFSIEDIENTIKESL